MISYAQNFEDVMLRRVFRDRKDGFYIDVGAMDPTFDSVTKTFYDEGWSGINIEPNEFFYNKLLAARPRDINLNLGVGAHEEARPIYIFERYGNSTFEERNRDSFAVEGYESQQRIVRVTTLAAVCREYVRREIDFLKIDCEGWEKLVIEGADWDRFRPVVVIVEATEPGTTNPSWSEWEPLLVEDGRYEMVYFDGLNRFYLRREYRDLRSHFAVPPNIFDGFTAHGTAAAEQARQAVEQERDNLAARIADLEAQLNGAAEENARLANLVTAKDTEMSVQTERHRSEIQELENKCGGLETENRALTQSLAQTRLWVGQLSQDIAVLKLGQRG